MSPAPVTQASNPEPEPETVEDTGSTEVIEEAEPEVSEPVTREADPQTPEPDEPPKRTLVHQTSPEEDALDLAVGDTFELDGETYDVIEHDRSTRRITLQVQ